MNYALLMGAVFVVSGSALLYVVRQLWTGDEHAPRGQARCGRRSVVTRQPADGCRDRHEQRVRVDRLAQMRVEA